MKFNKTTHKVIIASLTPIEARAYVEFLLEERARHYKEIGKGKQRILYLNHRSMMVSIASIEFWQSAITRHQGDIKEIDYLIKQVTEMYLR